MLPYEKSRALFDRDLNLDERSVRGNLVVGLSHTDIELLDVFEADVRNHYFRLVSKTHVLIAPSMQEYDRQKVQIYPLGPLEPLNSPSEDVIASSVSPLPAINELPEPVEADTYIWTAPTSLLVPQLWSYEVFIRDSSWKWVGLSADRESYAEVDRRRAMNGVIVRAAKDAIEGAVN